jgi:hypothetical protein
MILVGLMVTTVGCSKKALDTFENGTYTGSLAGQTLVISGDTYDYSIAGASLSGHYVIDGTTVTFVTTKIGGQNTGMEQKATYDFTTTSNSITLSNMRDLVNGGSGIAPDTFTK